MLNKNINKLFMLFLLLSLAIYPNLFARNTNIKAGNKYITYTYARVNEDNVYLYKTNISTFETNAYFAIPKTYFVILISNIDETFYKVQYRDIVGFVLKNKVTPVVETPQNPYLLNITFRVYTQDGLKMKSSPFNQDSTQTITTLPHLPTLTYYGQIIGDELIPDRGYLWYYCKYNDNNNPNTTYYGYVYAGFCDNLSPIQNNTEQLTIALNPFSDENNEYLYSLTNLTPELKYLITFFVCIPCLIIIYLLFKPFKIKNKLLKAQKIKRKKQQTDFLTKTRPSLEEDDTI